MMDAWDFLFASIFFCIAGLTLGALSNKARAEFSRAIGHDRDRAEQAVKDLRIAGIGMILLILAFIAMTVYWVFTGVKS